MDFGKLKGSQDLKEIQLENIDVIKSMAKHSLSIIHLVKDDEEKLHILQGLCEVMTECAMVEHKMHENERASAEAYKEVLQQLEEAFETGSQVAHMDHFIKMFKSLFLEKQNFLSEKEVTAHDTDIQVLKQDMEACEDTEIEKVVTIENEELVATEETINVIDPISKKVMTNPVRNKVCRHVYDKDTALKMIKQMKRKGFKCPTVGCSNRKNINPSDLVEAPDILRAIRLQESESL